MNSQTTEAVGHSDMLFRAVFDGALDAMVLVDDLRRVAQANRAALELFGAPMEAVSGRTARELGLLVETVDKGGTLRRADGALRDVEMTETLAVLPGLHLCVIRDVTDQTRALRRVKAQFDGIPVPTFVWQRSARGPVLIDYNAAAVKVSHGGITDALGMTATEFFESDAGMIADLERCLDQHETFQREMDRTLRGGTEPRRLLVTYSFCSPDLVLAHVDDLTERRRLEDQFRHAQKMEAVGRLAGGIAHDFNNLLSVILGYCGYFIEELSPSDPMLADIEEVHHAAKRASDLTRQLLVFSRQQAIEPRVLDLNETLGGLDRMLRRLVGEDIEVITVPGASLGRVRADAGSIEQVVMNLAVNARDAMPTGGTLTIATANVDLDGTVNHGGAVDTHGPHVMLMVTDTGIGMDSLTQAKMFEPFFTTKGLGKGTGLGLSTVFAIVEQSGGTIRVRSSPGLGSTFTVYLPRVKDSVANRRSIAPAGPLRGTETVLLVEDEDAVRAVFRSMLKRRGYTVLDARSAGEALLLCEQHGGPIHLLLTDVVMPRMSGPQLARRLLEVRPDTRVLFMSGYTDDSALRHGTPESGGIIQKPVSADTLARRVREALDAPQHPPHSKGG